MTDIYDIKDIILGFPIDFIYSSIYILFIFILYFIYKYLINKKDSKIEIINDIIVKKQEIDFNKILQEFELKFIDKNSEKFYSWLLEILRDILESFWNKNISKMTFEEISKINLDNDLKDIIKSIYYKEYVKQIEDSKEIRLSLINKIKELIK